MDFLLLLIILASVALVFIGFGTVIWWLLEGEVSPLRKWRKLRTPSCKECLHVHINPHLYEYKCVCPKAVDLQERALGREVSSVDSELVRGTSWCKFERKAGE